MRRAWLETAKPVERPASHLFAGELGVAGVEAAAEEAAAVDQVEAEGEEHQALQGGDACSVPKKISATMATHKFALLRCPVRDMKATRSPSRTQLLERRCMQQATYGRCPRDIRRKLQWHNNRG